MPLGHGNDMAAFDLRDTVIFLARDGTARLYPKSPQTYRAASADSEFMAGRMLACSYVKDAQDVHYPIWEMHPEGDEILIAMSGSLSVELRAAECVRLRPSVAFIVPAGLWHRLVVHEPSVLVSITPRRHTVHEEE